MRGNIGVRVPHTKQTGTSTDVITYENEYCVDGPGGDFDEDKPTGEDGNCLVIPQDGDPTATQPVPPRPGQVFRPNRESQRYPAFMPTFTIIWEQQSGRA